MKIAHCQFEAWAGDLEHNLARFEEGLKRGDETGAKVVTFPECFLTGYPDTEEMARKGAFAVESPQMRRVLEITARHAAVAIVGSTSCVEAISTTPSSWPTTARTSAPTANAPPT
ncbi:MAG: hypothetical protein JNN17_11285 [Verrucomicrobiaceae bacterium]|nr:hypothetical protein [Verrucomicrobiaceae bacterium]